MLTSGVSDNQMSSSEAPASVFDSKTSERLALGIILTLSAAAIAFLLWLLYLHHPTPELAQRWIFLPRLNALLNGLSAVALCVGLYFIKHQNPQAHRTSMLLAFGFSSLFLISYIVNHALRGDTPFPGVGTARAVYLSILASHILFSIVALPLVLTTLFFALSGRFRMHRRIARVTFPIWLYVSVTGVVVFVFLTAYAY
jgi:putative membrane protein